MEIAVTKTLKDKFGNEIISVSGKGDISKCPQCFADMGKMILMKEVIKKEKSDAKRSTKKKG